MKTKFTAVFSKISNADENMARLNALLHLSFDHVSGGALDEPNMETVGFALLMARQELDTLQENNVQLHTAYKALQQEVETVCRHHARQELEAPATLVAMQQRETASKSAAPKVRQVA